MKTISFVKKHLIWGIALMVGVVAMSFGMAKEQPVKKSTVYYYISNDASPGAFRNPANWSTVDNEVLCEGAEAELPCKVMVAENSSLNAVLGTKTNPQVLAISDGYKPFH